MWSGMMPAVTTKFTADGALDRPEMERCFARQIAAGNAGLVTCGTLGEGNMLSPDERLEVLATAKGVAQGRPVLLTISEPGTREACDLARRAARAGADGLMVVPSPIYHASPDEAVANLRAIAASGGLPVMIYCNPIGYRVDVTPEMLEVLAEDPLMVAVKESSDDIRRCTEIFDRLGDRFRVLIGVDNLGLEALLMGCDGWVSGVSVAFPEENQAIHDLVFAGRIDEARAIYRWMRPLLDLDVSTCLVQQIKLAEAITLGSAEHVRAPRQPMTGARRARVEALVRERIACRPDLPTIAAQGAA